MKYLIEAALRSGLEPIATQALENKNVHGIIIDLNPLWLCCYYYHLRFPDERIIISQYDRGYVIYNSRDYLYFQDWGPRYFHHHVPIDLNWYPENWREFQRGENNLIVRIQLRPGSKPAELANRESSLTIVQEHSAVPNFSASNKKMSRPLQGGVSIGHSQDGPGTLGGILKDKAGIKYGLTCGHVINQTQVIVDQPSVLDNTTTTGIGTCVYNRLPTPNNGQLCNPRNINFLNDMDVALIQFNSQIAANLSILKVGMITGHTPAINLHPNLRIEFSGRSSGHKTLVTGGIGFVQEIEDSATGNKSCVRNLIEIKQPVLGNLTLRRPVKGGDSGAWLVTSGNSGLEWCGMIIGGKPSVWLRHT